MTAIKPQVLWSAPPTGCLTNRPRPLAVSVRPNGRLSPAGKAEALLKLRGTHGFFSGLGKVGGHAPRYGVAGLDVAQTRRNARFYALRKFLGRRQKLIELQKQRRAQAYGWRRTAEIRHLPSMRSLAGGAPWHR